MFALFYVFVCFSFLSWYSQYGGVNKDEKEEEGEGDFDAVSSQIPHMHLLRSWAREKSIVDVIRASYRFLSFYLSNLFNDICDK